MFISRYIQKAVVITRLEEGILLAGRYSKWPAVGRFQSVKKMSTMKRFTLVRHFQGEPKLTDFNLLEEPIPEVKDQEVHFKAIVLSVDPYMRPYSASVKLGETMIGEQVAKVIESKHPDYKAGDIVAGAYFGWCTDYVGNPEKLRIMYGVRWKPYVLPDFEGLPLSLAVGVLGMTGNTAYFGLTELLEPKPGKTLVISGAAGAVGSHVGQIGKILGLKVIGFAGSDDKVKYLVDELKFDHAFNYKKVDVIDALKQSAPNGVDCYFDNVGGVMSSDILKTMNTFGRVAICGAISGYNDSTPVLAPTVQMSMIGKQIRMEGFIVYRWADRWLEGIKQNMQWIKEGKLRYREHITTGFENTSQAFIGMLRGENTGKAIVMV